MPRISFPLTLGQFRAYLEGIQLTSYSNFNVIFQAAPPLIVADGKSFTIADFENGIINPVYSWEKNADSEQLRVCQALKIALAMSGNTLHNERLLKRFTLHDKSVTVSLKGLA